MIRSLVIITAQAKIQYVQSCLDVRFRRHNSLKKDFRSTFMEIPF